MDSEKKAADQVQGNEAEGVELDDAQLEGIAGGTTAGPCPACGSTNLRYVGGNTTLCEDCGWNG